jgi:hypothetical protein
VWDRIEDDFAEVGSHRLRSLSEGQAKAFCFCCLSVESSITMYTRDFGHCDRASQSLAVFQNVSVAAHRGTDEPSLAASQRSMLPSSLSRSLTKI